MKKKCAYTKIEAILMCSTLWQEEQEEGRKLGKRKKT